MSAGSDASNFGYGSVIPNSNVNGNFVNVGGTNNPSNFSSNEIPGLPGLAGSKFNIDAAAGRVPGICLIKGGAKKLKKKINNITKKYKRMKISKSKLRSIKNRVKARYASRSLALGKSQVGGKYRHSTKNRKRGRSQSRRRSQGQSRRRSQSRYQRGGHYLQYQNNLPLTQTYSVGGILSSNESALASPAPVNVLCGGTNCIDNYNHNTGKGTPSIGH